MAAVRPDVHSDHSAVARRFDQTCHVQWQLESIAHKGRSLPKVSPLVDARFMAGLGTLVLAANHDADRPVWPLVLDATRGGEAFEQMSGKVRRLEPNDMMMADARGIVRAVLYGQDRRTPISPQTRRVLYVCYVPSGIPAPLV